MKFILPLLLVGSTIDLPYDIMVNKAEETKALYVVAENDRQEYVNLISYHHKNKITYEEIKLEAISDCKYRDPSLIDEAVIDELIMIEKSFNVPVELRGMLLAAACLESGYNSHAEGDKKFSKSGKKPMAIGILQLWKWWERAYDVNRTSISQSATAWMTHIKKMLPKVRRQCKIKNNKDLWVAAWVTGIRSPKPDGRCNERPTHYRLLKKWHKKIKKNRESVEEHFKTEKDGC